MMAAIPSGLTDDNDFIELLNSMLSRLLEQQAPAQLWVIQIDNWFDHKWLRYSAFGVLGSNMPTDGENPLKVDSRPDKLTFPPFAPNRVLGQWSFVRGAGGYIEAPLPQLPHGADRRSNHSSLPWRAENPDGTAVFAWYSGNTLKNGRGSVMVYSISESEPVCWFASFGRDKAWSLQLTKNVDREYVLGLLPASAE
jgi:hypothetical protein